MTQRKIKVGITHGDTNGVGYELIFKTFADAGMLELCTPVVYGAAKVAAYHRKALDINVNYHLISAATEAQDDALNFINCFDGEVKIELGHPDSESGKMAFLALERAVADCRAGDIDVLVTAPICKAGIQGEDFHFAGHTEYLCDRLGEGAEPLMILCADSLRVALVTTHLALKDVAEAVTRENIVAKGRLLNDSLRRDFLISAPRIAVLALNPHGGDAGLIGTEETDIIAPAVEELKEAGIACFGPYPADGFFGAGSYRHFDGVLAMYHDQGLAPFKALVGGEGINFTAGLPVVRTSPDHGTAFDIAGQGIASEDSFRRAVYTAVDIFRNRQADAEAYRNPLKKLYHDRREDGERRHHSHETPQA